MRSARGFTAVPTLQLTKDFIRRLEMFCHYATMQFETQQLQGLQASARHCFFFLKDLLK